VAALLVSSLINAVLFFRIIEIAYFKPAPETSAAPPRSEEAPALLLTPLLLTAVTLVAIGLGTGPLVENVIRLALPPGFAP
jgi:multicomponent Na+:H+ antiporter subunit D